MKKSYNNLFISLIILGFMAYTSVAFADSPAPPPPGGSHGQTANGVPSGGGAPIGGGLGILLAMGTAYGAKKIYKVWKDKDELES